MSLAVLLAWIGGLALAACGLNGLWGRKGGLDVCPTLPSRALPVQAELLAEQGREGVLRDRLARLRLALAAVPACPRPPSDTRPEPAIVPPSASLGPADLPRVAWEARDLSMLEGCWRLITQYHSPLTGERLEPWRVCFEAAGQGWQDLVLDQRARCHGPIRASFDGAGRLVLRFDQTMPCSAQSGRSIVRRELTCQRQSDSAAACQVRLIDYPGRDGQATFQR